LPDEYKTLKAVLDEALLQASVGKGKERHAVEGVPFEKQISCIIEWELPGYASGQAAKKIFEASRLPTDRAIHELLGAINYLVIAIIVKKGKL